MARYNKGANAERELIKSLDLIGFAVLRVAGSGVNPLPCPDVVALKNGKIIAFECKAKKGEYLAIKKQQMFEEVNWSKKAGAKFVIAWKVPRNGWLFIDPRHFNDSGKNFMIKLDFARSVAMSLQDLPNL